MGFAERDPAVERGIDYAWSRPHGLIEKPGQYADECEAWVYCNSFSYDQGATVSLKTHTTAEEYEIEIVRDGLQPQTVFKKAGLKGKRQETPDDAYAVGCGWSEALAIQLDKETWAPGYYVVIIRILDAWGRDYEREGFFIVKSPLRASSRKADADLVLVHATSTLLAYNDWGGANHYRGISDGFQNDTPSPASSTQRPIARGMVRLQAGAPREGNGVVVLEHGDLPRYPNLEYAWFYRYSRHYADAGWAMYERPFTVWAETNGYKVHHLTQSDLHCEPHCLDGYSTAVAVGHDEYHSWESRDTMDRFIENGGNLARFGGNYIWQVRFDDKMQTQYCYRIPQADPITSTDPKRVTTMWDWDPIGRPGAQTVGLTGIMGCYTKYGTTTPKATGGFQIYRPKHWSLKDTGVRYGDFFGTHPINIVAFEVDGVDYEMRKGLPYPTGADGAPSNLEIIAMAPATLGELDEWHGKVHIGGPITDVTGLLEACYETLPMPEYLKDREYGSAMIAGFEKGNGQVYCAGTCEWVVGLMKRDYVTETITKNVLGKFTGKS